MAEAVKDKGGTTGRIIKALSLFTGVQIVQIVCSVLRTKLVALWIGPIGVGLITLYNATIDFLSTASQLNLRQSAVRDISEAAGNEELEGATVKCVRTIAFILGIAGSVLVLLSSPLLSIFTFENTSHTVSFMILSPMLLLSATASGNWAIMQGLGKLKALARSTLWASVTATMLAIPLFWFYREAGIVPVLLIFAACNALYSIVFKVKTARIRMSVREAFRRGAPMLNLGFWMTAGAGFTLLGNYIFASWLNRHSGATGVGIYQAGYTLVNTYAGMLFGAIATEYYPRLTAHKSRHRIEVTVSHEIKVLMWIIMPVAIMLISLKGFVIDILYSSEFDAAQGYVSLAAIGLILRGASFCMAYSMLARGDGRIYVFTEAISAVVYLCVNTLFYTRWGYPGLGAAYIVWYAAYCVTVYLVMRMRYGLRLVGGVDRLIAFSCLMVSLSYLLDTAAGWYVSAAVGLIIAGVAIKKLRRQNDA